MARDTSPRARRPRPVADAPVAALVARAESIAKGWLLELLDALPLSAAGTLPAADFARQAPVLCAAVARALASDDELARLGEGGDLRPLAEGVGRLTGAPDAPAAVAAVGALRAVTWAVLRDAVGDDDATLVADLAQRLAHVEAIVAEAALAAPAGTGRAAARPSAATPEVAWPPALEGEVAAARERSAPLAVLLVEVDGAERIVASEGARRGAELLARALEAVRGVVRPGDAVHPQGEGRLWVLAPGLDGSAAAALAARLGWAVEDAVEVHGAPLTASVGMAVHPADGGDAAVLAARAEEALFAARASGLRVGGVAGEGEVRPGPWLVR